MMRDEGARFQELSRLFDELVELDAVEREVLIQSRCAGRLQGCSLYFL